MNVTYSTNDAFEAYLYANTNISLQIIIIIIDQVVCEKRKSPYQGLSFREISTL